MSTRSQPRQTPYNLATAPGYAARRLYQAYSALWLTSVDAAITGPQFAVMTAVRAIPGVDQRSLAASVSLDTSTMADICRRLEGRGLISREVSAEDARRKVLRLTPEGETTLDEVTDRSRALNERLLEVISVERRSAIVAEMLALSEHWENMAAGH
ncbi:MAG: MarR family winged helix-turn-helix transcriptional regulator [Actinomycetota bacterium]|nr:MarR family winged helix-turn-helix transcriptional regulator [Actinomycetota bacterium]